MKLNQVYIRGNALDYDRWEKEGAKGENCDPQKVEVKRLQNDKTSSTKGGFENFHLTVSFATTLLNMQST